MCPYSCYTAYGYNEQDATLNGKYTTFEVSESTFRDVWSSSMDSKVTPPIRARNLHPSASGFGQKYSDKNTRNNKQGLELYNKLKTTDDLSIELDDRTVSACVSACLCARVSYDEPVCAHFACARSFSPLFSIPVHIICVFSFGLIMS